MNGSKIILIVCEGEKTEQQVVSNLKSIFFKNRELRFEMYYHHYGSHIYSFYELYSKLNEDKYLDTVGLLIENYKKMSKNFSNDSKDKIKVESKIEELEKIKDKISQIYLFFDYDGQGQGKKYTESNIEELIDFFDDESENGKIYINYPMCEAVKDFLKSDYCTRRCKVPAKYNIGYKRLVNDVTDFKHITKLTRDYWLTISFYSVKKLNCVASGVYTYPENFRNYTKLCTQKNLFKMQLKKILSENKIFVISAFPFFLIDYFGESFYIDIINGNNYLKPLEITSSLN